MSEVELEKGIERSENANVEGGRLKRGLLKMIHSDRMIVGIGLASFLESTVVPIPLETILIPLMQARRERLLAIATAVLVGCLLGAVVGYGIGFFVFDAVGHRIVSWFGSEQEFEAVRQQMGESGFGFVFSVGVTPVPFQIAMLAAGATKFSLLTFLLASALARGIRYFGLAALVYFFGNRAQRLYEEHKVAVAIAILIAVVAFWIF